ncbi:MAG: FAD-binding protein, partial [Pseudomonadota bacterium]
MLALTELTNGLEAAIAKASDERLDADSGFDAIVVGGGAAGGLAAMSLTQGGLNVLLLDAGWETGLMQTPFRHALAAGVQSVANPALQRV